MPEEMTFGSLFSGIGGLDLGLERAGMTCKWQVEIDGHATRVLERHWPYVRRWRDVRDFIADAASKKQCIGRRCKQPCQFCETWRVDGICGGFPCQPVSVAGRQLGDRDERWLWPEFNQVIRLIKPRWVLVENVPGLLSADSGRLFGAVLRNLAEGGYDAEWQVLPAAAFGAPHIRERLFVIGTLDSNSLGITSRASSKRKHEGANDAERICCEVPDTNKERSSRKGCGKLPEAQRARQLRQTRAMEWWWSVEPDVGRVAHGVPSRVDRLRGLGNAVVPQVAEWIGRQICQMS